MRRRIWLLYAAQQRFPIDQAIEWARIAEDFLSGATLPPRSPEISARISSASAEVSRGAQRSGSKRETILQLIKENPDGLTRREILELLQVKGNKAAEASASNVLQALMKRKEVIRHERKYRAAEEQAR